MQIGWAVQSAPQMPQQLVMAPVMVPAQCLPPRHQDQFPLQLQTCQQQSFQRQPQLVAPFQQQAFQQQYGGSLASSCLPNGVQPVGLHTGPSRIPITVQGSPLGEHEVVSAVESLYRDQLKPYGRILRKRLIECAEAVGFKSADIDVRRLRAVCNSHPCLCVRIEDGGDWSAIIRDRADTFVNVYSPDDIYPAETWRAMEDYLTSLDDKTMVLPGGRYSCAQVLKARQLPFLASYSLGQVSHIVQLAISQKRLLGYLNGHIVPYGHSKSMMKQQCAERQRPSTGMENSYSLGTWDTVHRFLNETLGCMGHEEYIPLSKLKRLFRSKCCAELSETALGYAKLSELLQDPRLCDVCSVRLQNQVYAVFPPRAQPTLRNQISLLDSLFSRDSGEQSSCQDNCGSSGSSLSRRKPAPLCMEEIVAPQAVDPPMGLLDSNVATEARSCRSVKGMLFPPTPEAVTPSWSPMPAATRLPTLLDRSTGTLVKEAANSFDGADKLGSIAHGCLINGKKVQPHAPGITSQAEVEAKQPQRVWTMPLLTPSTIARLRNSEQNTFINMPAPPPTPQLGACSRSRSLPRCIN